MQVEKGLSPLKSGQGNRLVSLDAFRGLIMLTLASSGFGARRMAQLNPDSAFWQTMGFQMSHTPWESHFWGIGVAYWDLILPAFLFMVGMAMPYSYGRRRAGGQANWQLFQHVLIRSLVLVLLGIFLQSLNSPRQTNWSFYNVLTQIGLGYWFLYLLLGRGVKVQVMVCALILLGHWLAYVLYPAPAEGFFAHWTKNANVGAAFDDWFLGLFPRDPAVVNFPGSGGNAATINFLPSIVTMAFGLMCGELLRSPIDQYIKWRRLVLAGATCMVLGLVAGYSVCPIIKKLTTPSWILFSGAYVIWIFALLFLVVDVLGWQRWTFPLVVVGMNSILMYLMGQLISSWTGKMLQIHLGAVLFGGPYTPVISATSVVVVFWLICYWLYRQKIFLRI